MNCVCNVIFNKTSEPRSGTREDCFEKNQVPVTLNTVHVISIHLK